MKRKQGLDQCTLEARFVGWRGLLLRNGGRKGRLRSCHIGSEFHGEHLRCYSVNSEGATEVVKQRNTMIRPLIQI